MPTCVIWEPFVPVKIKLSGNDWIRAASRTVMARFKYGWVKRPEEGVSNRVVIVTEMSSRTIRDQVPL